MLHPSIPAVELLDAAAAAAPVRKVVDSQARTRQAGHTRPAPQPAIPTTEPSA
jgi:hypothetical protein